MSQSRLQRAQAPRMPPRPSTAGLYPLCLAQRPSNFLDRTFKRAPAAEIAGQSKTYCIPRLGPSAVSAREERLTAETLRKVKSESKPEAAEVAEDAEGQISRGLGVRGDSVWENGRGRGKSDADSYTPPAISLSCLAPVSWCGGTYKLGVFGGAGKSKAEKAHCKRVRSTLASLTRIFKRLRPFYCVCAICLAEAVVIRCWFSPARNE